MNDQIVSPKHYEVVPGLEADKLIKLVLNSELCKNMTGHQIGCLYSVLKYRLRAGKKDDPLQDIAKSDHFVDMGWSECNKLIWPECHDVKD